MNTEQFKVRIVGVLNQIVHFDLKKQYTSLVWPSNIDNRCAIYYGIPVSNFFTRKDADNK